MSEAVKDAAPEAEMKKEGRGGRGRGGRGGRGRGRGGRGGRGPSDDSSKICYQCGQAGHLSRDCTNPRLEGDDRESINRARAQYRRCFNCGKMGHLSADCTRPAGNQACYNCQGEGHIGKLIELLHDWLLCRWSHSFVCVFQPKTAPIRESPNRLDEA
jgi:cellular nucleic acid-binding protein